MARFTAATEIDMLSFMSDASLIDFFANADVSGNSRRVDFTQVDPGITERLTLNGSFGGYVGGVPTTGAMTRAQYSITGGVSFELTGVSMTVADFSAFVEAEAIDGLFNQLLSGNDTIRGSEGNDILLGFGGNDFIDGRGGADFMAGMTGNDRYVVDNAEDHVIEMAGEGTDAVNAYANYTLDAEVENLYLFGAVTQAAGNDLANTIVGSDSGNSINGGAGNDILRGEGGQDTLVGGAGADTIDGGVGRDTLTGNGGADTFVFANGDFGITLSRADTITDFNQLQGDKIKLSPVDANINVDGDQKFTFLGTGAFTGQAGQLHYSQAGGMTYVEADLNGDAVADLYLVLNGNINLTASDFNL